MKTKQNGGGALTGSDTSPDCCQDARGAQLKLGQREAAEAAAATFSHPDRSGLPASHLCAALTPSTPKLLLNEGRQLAEGRARLSLSPLLELILPPPEAPPPSCSCDVILFLFPPSSLSSILPPLFSTFSPVFVQKSSYGRCGAAGGESTNMVKSRDPRHLLSNAAGCGRIEHFSSIFFVNF